MGKAGRKKLMFIENFCFNLYNFPIIWLNTHLKLADEENL